MQENAKAVRLAALVEAQTGNRPYVSDTLYLFCGCKPYQFHPRKILGGKTPYRMALETLGEKALNAFQLKPIEPDKVNLTPKLIRFNR